LPRGTIVEHVTLDGYANGWRIRGVLPDGPLHLVATYEPAFVARKALAVSQWTALALALALLGGQATRRITVLRMFTLRRAGSAGVDDAGEIWSDTGVISPMRARVSALPDSTIRPTDSVANEWRSMSRARLSLGVLLGAVGFGCAVRFAPSSLGVVAASVLGIAVLSPPWKWLFGAGLAALTIAVGASGFGAEQASDVLVIASFTALVIALALAAVQTVSSSRPDPVEVGAGAVVAVVPYAPLPEPMRSAMVPSARPLPLSTGDRTPPATMDGRRGALAKLVSDLDVNIILDVGCGRGFLLPTLVGDPRFEMHGVDVYPEHERSVAGYPTTAGRRLPYDDAAFDCVILGDVVEHVQEPDPLLSEVRRVLRPGGWLVISTPNVVSWANRVLVPLGALPRLTGTLTDANVQLPLFTVFTPRSLELLLKTTGYAVLRKEGTPSSFPFPLSLADRALSRYPSVASGLLYAARRDDD
jgi:SAM-dependent methyltransferase